MKNKLLIDYIKKQRKKGFSYERIRDYLKSYNYNPTEVKECIDYVIRRKKHAANLLALVLVAILVIGIFLSNGLLKSSQTDIIQEKDTAKTTQKNTGDAETGNDLLTKISEKKKTSNNIFVDKLKAGDGSDQITAGQDIGFSYTMENIKPVQMDGVFRSAYMINLLIIAPDRSIVNDPDKRILNIRENEFKSEERQAIKDVFFLSFDDEQKGEYTIIASFLDIYNNEETAAAVTIEVI